MNKILLLAFVGLVWSGANGFRLSSNSLENHHLVHENDYDSDLVEQVEQVDKEPVVDQVELRSKLAEACLIQILGPSVTCITRSLTKWNIPNPYQLKTLINDKPTCCTIWDTTDCLLDKAQLHCSEEERTAFEAHMSEETAKRNEKNCSLIQYKSSVCNDEGEEFNESPALTKVSYRQHKHLVNTDQLAADDVQPKKHMTGSGRVHHRTHKVHVNDQSVADSLDELTLAHRLLDRVDRITINQVVIDLHPIKHKEMVEAPKQELDSSLKEVEFDP